jgi:hypothetical protein
MMFTLHHPPVCLIFRRLSKARPNKEVIFAMSTPSKKQSKQESLNPTQRRFFLSITRFIFSSDYIRFRIWVILIPLLILIITGNLLTKSGLLILLIIFCYILLSHLHKWLEKQEEK